MKFFFLTIFFFSSEQVFATKARLEALSFSHHLVDEQFLFSNPLNLHYLGNLVSLEAGLTSASSTTTATSNAEGIAVRSLQEIHLGLALGHQDETVVRTRTFINALGYTYDFSQNPMQLFWGAETDEANFALALSYSRFEDKVSSVKESVAGLNMAAELGAWQFMAASVFENKVETASNHFDGSGNIGFGVNYIGDSTRAFVKFNREPLKSNTASLESEFHIIQKFRLGIIESNIKEENEVFWGAEVDTLKVDCQTRLAVGCTGDNYIRTTVPVWAGFEIVASSWVVLRASINQTFIFNQTKDDHGYPVGILPETSGLPTELVNGSNVTKVSAGVGLKLRDVTIDGLLAASSSQQLNSTNFVSQLGVKYVY